MIRDCRNVRDHLIGPLGIGFCFLTSALAQTSPVPYADGQGPSYSAVKAAHSYPGSYRSIGEVDFRNLNNGQVTLRNGHFQRNEPFFHYNVTLDAVAYMGDNAALVFYGWFGVGGSSSSGEDAVVFTVSKGHLQSVQSIRWETHSAGSHPTWSFEPNTLMIRSDHYRPGDAHCCISAVDVVTFHWDGKEFAPTIVKTELLNR